MAKKRQYRRAMKIPLGVTLGLSATLLGTGQTDPTTALEMITRGDYTGAFGKICSNLIGVDPVSGGTTGFNAARLNWMPLIIGSAASILASKLGINRRLAALGLPIKI